MPASLLELPTECRLKIIDDVLAVSKPHIDLKLFDDSWNVSHDWQGCEVVQVKVTAQNVPHPLLLVLKTLYLETKPRIKISAKFWRTIPYSEEEYAWGHVAKSVRECIDELTIANWEAAIPRMPNIHPRHVRIEGRGGAALFFVTPSDKLQLKYGNVHCDAVVSESMIYRVEGREFDIEIAQQMAALLKPKLWLYTGHVTPTYSMTMLLKLRMWLTRTELWSCNVLLDYDAMKILEWKVSPRIEHEQGGYFVDWND